MIYKAKKPQVSSSANRGAIICQKKKNAPNQKVPLHRNQRNEPFFECIHTIDGYLNFLSVHNVYVLFTNWIIYKVNRLQTKMFTNCIVYRVWNCLQSIGYKFLKFGNWIVYKVRSSQIEVITKWIVYKL